MVDVESSKVEVESSVGTQEENTERNILYGYIVIQRESLYRGYYMVKCKDEKGTYTLIIIDNVRPNLCCRYYTNRYGAGKDSVKTIQ